MVVAEPYDLTCIEATEISPVSKHRLPKADISRTVEYSNCLTTDVQIAMRDGQPFTIPRHANAKGRAFIVSVSYKVAGDVYIDDLPMLADGCYSQELKLIQKSLETCEAASRGYVNMGLRDKVYTIEYRYSEDDLLNNGGAVYLQEIDLTLSINPNVDVRHPYAAASAPWSLIENELNYGDLNRFNYSIYIVSNNKAISDRFINVHNKVYRVPVIQNHSLRDGIYLCSTAPLEKSSVGSPLPKIDAVYDYEEGESVLRLFKTVEEARINGDEEHRRAQEIKDLTLELKRAERKHKEQMADLERTLKESEMKRQEERIEMEDRYERRKQERKDHYDERSHSRKDTSEIFKYLTVFLSAVLTALGIFQKFNAK